MQDAISVAPEGGTSKQQTQSSRRGAEPRIAPGQRTLREERLPRRDPPDRFETRPDGRLNTECGSTHLVVWACRGFAGAVSREHAPVELDVGTPQAPDKPGVCVREEQRTTDCRTV